MKKRVIIWHLLERHNSERVDMKSLTKIQMNISVSQPRTLGVLFLLQGVCAGYFLTEVSVEYFRIGFNRHTVTEIFRSIWVEGKSPDNPQQLAELAAGLEIDDVESAIQQPSVKDQLRLNTECATKLGVFGVPTIVIDDQLFWGDDLTVMAMDYLDNHTLFDQGPYPRLGTIPSGLES